MSLLAVLSVYMYILFRRERREALAFEGHAAPAAVAATPASDHGHSDHGHGDHGHAPAPAAVPAADHGHAAPAADHGHAPATPAHHEPMAAAPAKKKASLVWRTAHIWLPLVAGFGGQAYLDLIKPMLEKTTG